MKKVIPKADQVLFKRIYLDRTTGGIILTGTGGPTAEQYTINTVTAIGDKVTRVKPGDEIIANLTKAIQIDIPDPDIEPEQVLIPEEAILATLEKEKEDGQE